MSLTTKPLIFGSCLLTCIIAAVAFGDDPAAPATPGSQALGRADDATSGRVVRASKVIGMTVYNEADEKIGSVNDLVLDPMTGKVRYAALSFGGFLGLGDKLFAVPWKAFTCKEGKDSGDIYLILDVEESVLKNAPGFDQNNWPDFADRTVTNKLDNHYRVKIDVNGVRR